MLTQDLAALNWFPLAKPAIRIEEHYGSRCVVRAELPGIDPARHVAVSVRDGWLRLVLVRLPDLGWRAHTQFRYGVFQRMVRLPAGVGEPFTLTYRAGVLEVALTRHRASSATRSLPVTIPTGVPSGSTTATASTPP